MERCELLINKLKDQYQQKVDPAVMMTTVQLLQAELAQMISAAPNTKGSGKVSVVMPSSNKIVTPSSRPAVHEEHDNRFVPKPAVADHTATALGRTFEPKPVEVKVEKKPDAAPTLSAKPEQPGWPVDPEQDIPTLSKQNGYKEINEVIGQKSESLNDRWKSGQTELKSMLTATPIRDLKKAIGINDRFVFLRELFRGDEAMYERSIKTINNFRIFPEAQYWIERELKIKLGWDENADTVQHFYQLVKRRFS